MTVPKPRLLFLCQTLPYPPDGGVQIRTYNVMRLLAAEYDITALCFVRAADRRNELEIQSSIAGLKDIARVEAFPIAQEHSKGRLVVDHLVSVLTQRAYTIRVYDSSAFEGRLRELIDGQRFDLVHMDSLDLAGYLPMLADLPVICVHHNVESQLLMRRAATTSGLAGRYIELQARLTEREERRWCPQVELNVAVSENDKVGLEAIAPEADVVVVPNGVDSSTFQPGNESDDGIVFVGAYSWQPNRDAMEYFCAEVLPILRARGINPKVTWVGRASDEVKRRYATEHGVELTGYVDDIRPVVLGAACYVAPLRAGGGTRLKILDAFAMGKAVVSTAVGCEGIDTRDGENILIRDTPEEFADAVALILSKPDVRKRLGAAARRTAEEQYDWQVIGRPMLDHYRKVLKGPRDVSRSPASP